MPTQPVVESTPAIEPPDDAGPRGDCGSPDDAGPPEPEAPRRPKTLRLDARFAAVLRELADLGRRIGERAEELARLSQGQSGDSAPLAAETRALVSAAERVAGRVRAAQPHVVVSAGRPGSRAKRAAKPRRRPTRLGPLLASSLAHVAIVALMAMVYVAGKAEPVPVAITLGAPADEAFDDAAIIDLAEIEAEGEEADEAPDEAPLEPLLDEALAQEDAQEAIEAIALDEPLPLLEEATAETADTAAVADVAEAPAAQAPQAAADGAAGEGKPAGGRRGGAPGGRAATFFGRVGQASSVCFLCDNSNSYRDGRFHAVLEEVARAVEALRPDQRFFVVFFSDTAYPLLHPDSPGELLPATPDNKRKLRAWLSTVEMCRGGQGIHDAVKLAATLDAEAVYLLSDGELGPTVVRALEQADFGGAAVHTFGLQQTLVDRRTGRLDPDRLREQQGLDRNLMAVAAAHGGTFTPVTVPPHAAALERLRPIPRNRSRGAVWGLKL